MNTASQDLGHHLGVLREKLEHATDYEKAFYYFLEEFAGDAQFVAEGQAEDAPHLLAVVAQVASKALGNRVQPQDAKVWRLAEFRFSHGAAAVGGQVAMFFYFEEVNTGLVALIPGVRGGPELGRFRLPDGLLRPQQN